MAGMQKANRRSQEKARTWTVLGLDIGQKTGVQIKNICVRSRLETAGGNLLTYCCFQPIANTQATYLNERNDTFAVIETVVVN